VRYDRWAPRYEAIRSEFGFPFEREELAATTLERLLRPPDRVDPLGRLRVRLEGRTVIVAGLAPGAGPPPVWRLPPAPDRPALIAADGAAERCLAGGLVPAIIVTDLDGPVPSEVTANQRGSLVVVHAHGDNVPALERWVPEFPGELAGSWAGPPRAALIDVGGFTDGDRAAYLAEELGARRILLWGFDFEKVDAEREPSPSRKLAKLVWARRLIEELAVGGRAAIVRWNRDGSQVPYGRSTVESTR
jgi:2-amino-4-hydroxy-6-hydroxymethyldihydropteridine diphosphokinase